QGKVFDRSHRKINKDLKGVWVATVVNLDFPKTRGANLQKQEIDEIVSNVKSWGMNAIFLQIKPSAGVFYKSKTLP
ncbi:family 10 glycosylhydrolase, partial [Oceanivirga salmonicida]|uniref:family 10 glycosylhydrolase n=1 Tax=Oceanivirga salmonicida TaxID=1769291 RepID=UPI0012E397EB